jgi:DNA-binding Lrp family transcriptional regulator
MSFTNEQTQGNEAMVTSIILLNVERAKINEVAEALAEMDGISEVYSVSGSYDLVAIARVVSNEKLSELVTSQMVKVPGIQKTETMLAFQTFSRHDLDSMFSIGLDGI